MFISIKSDTAVAVAGGAHFRYAENGCNSGVASVLQVEILRALTETLQSVDIKKHITSIGEEVDRNDVRSDRANGAAVFYSGHRIRTAPLKRVALRVDAKTVADKDRTSAFFFFWIVIAAQATREQLLFAGQIIETRRST